MSTIIVRLRKQGGEAETLRFDKEEVYIGRLEQNDITLSMTNVSKKHAIIWVDGSTVYVSDAGSTNGTYVNKRRISQPTPLTPTDEVYVGDFIFEVSLERDNNAPPPYEAPAPTAVPVAPPPAYEDPRYIADAQHLNSSAGNATTIGNSTIGAAARGSMMPPPPRSTPPAPNQPFAQSGAYKSVQSTQVSPAASRIDAQRLSQPIQATPAAGEDLSDIYLDEQSAAHPSIDSVNFREVEAAASSLDYNAHQPQRDTTGSDGQHDAVSPNKRTPYGNYGGPSNPAGPPAPGVVPPSGAASPIGTGLGANGPSPVSYDRHEPMRADFSTRSESKEVQAPGPAPSSIAQPPKGRFGNTNGSDKPLSSLNNRARPLRNTGGNPAINASPLQSSRDAAFSRKSSQSISQRNSSLLVNRESPETNLPITPPADLFSFPPEIPETKDPYIQTRREELFNGFIETLEADGFIPYQISPLSREILIPYLTQIDGDQALQDAFAEELVHMGPLDTLLDDNTITEIYVNRYNQIVVKRGTSSSYADYTFHSPESLRLTAKRLAKLDASQPNETATGTFVDIRFRENALATVTIPADQELGPLIVIQRKEVENETLEALVQEHVLSEAMADFLIRSMASGLNILIAGPFGAHKLRLLSALASLLPSSVRLVYLSRGHNIKIPETGVTLYEADSDQFDMQSMLMTATSLRPDRVMLERVNGVEAYTWVTSIATSVEGCITTISASSTQDALGNLLTLSMLANHVPSPYAIKEQIARSIDLVVTLNNIGSNPRVISIAEIDGVDIGSFRINDIFRYKMIDSLNGQHEATGYIPQAYETLRQSGIDVDISIFRD